MELLGLKLTALLYYHTQIMGRSFVLEESILLLSFLLVGVLEEPFSYHLGLQNDVY